VTSLACRPASLAPGGSSTCTVILANAAPAAGATVTLSDNQLSLGIPASISIPSGYSSGTFTATFSSIASTQAPVITANSGASVTNTLTLNPAAPAVLRVGPGQIYSRPCQAIAAATDGVTIQIDATGSYMGDVCAITANNLTLKGVNGRPKIDAGGLNALGKGTWVVSGNNTTIDTVEFTGAIAAGNNAAGVRLDGQHLAVLNSYFHDNQAGLLTSANPASQVVVLNSEFNHNGSGDGATHNLHVNSAARLTLQYSYSHNAVAGNLV